MVERAKLGFIGCGNMARALIGGVIASGYADPRDILASEPSEEAREQVAGQYGIVVTGDNVEVMQKAGTVFLCVKPQVIGGVLGEISGALTEEHLLVTVVAGKELDYYTETLGAEKKTKVVRLMPNTPAMIGAGMTAICANDHVTEEELAGVRTIVSAVGEAQVVPESLFDTVTAVSGSSPAYVFMFIEAMADAAVQGGMTRAQAYRFAAQAVAGSAQLVLQTGRHPAELKDMVCSPAGTTIEAVRVLEECGLRTAVIEAMAAARERSAAMRSEKG